MQFQSIVWSLALAGLAACASGKPAGRLPTAGEADADATSPDAASNAGGEQRRDAASMAGASGLDAGGGVGGTGGGVGGTGGAPPADAADDLSGSPDAATATGASGQGPTAEGKIVFSQDFEANMDGISRSPTDLPEDRALIADDPLGQRGKVMKITWQAGDSYMTHGGSTHTRSWISNTGYSFAAGSTVSIAWGYMTSNVQIDAAMAQVIHPGGPMWLIEGTGDGSTYVNCRSCGGMGALPVKFMPNRWYDLRVEMTYASGGPVQFFVDGVKVLERKMTGGGAPAHWDGGIYNHAAGTTTRTIYISNLSVGIK